MDDLALVEVLVETEKERIIVIKSRGNQCIIISRSEFETMFFSFSQVTEKKISQVTEVFFFIIFFTIF